MPTTILDHPSVLSGYSQNTTPALVTVASHDAAARWQRSIRGLGQCWGLAVLSVFIPVAHFFLVPGFFVAGIVVFFQRRGAALVVQSARGACPDCGAEQTFDAPTRWEPQLTVDCKQCHRRLTLTARTT